MEGEIFSLSFLSCWPWLPFSLVLSLESTLEERVMRRGRGERVPANEQANCVPVAFFSASSSSVQADQSTVYRKNPDSWIPPLFLQPLTQWPWAKNFTSVGFCFPSCQMVGIKGQTTFWSVDQMDAKVHSEVWSAACMKTVLLSH